MTIWIYNPPEPTGQPTAPGPWDAPGQSTGFDLADPVTGGRCGNCPACPKIWRMEVPYLPGDPFAARYAGVVYLQRLPYQYVPSPDAGSLLGKCSWASTPAPPFPDRNPYNGPYNDGWSLTYQFNAERNGFTWSLYSPVEDGTLITNRDAQTRWCFNGIQFRCLETNTFQRFDTPLVHPFPYVVDFLTITAFPG